MVIILLLLLLTFSTAVRADCTLTESVRKFEGADRTVVHLENERIVVEVVPELEGRIIKYQDKTKPGTGFEWLDDCPYHFAGKWEGTPFTHRVEARGGEKAAVTVIGGGKIAVALLHSITGANVANPIDLKVERTMTISANSTRLQVDVKITNSGEGVAPGFRYMVHSVFGQVPQFAGNGGRAFWFLPTPKGVEFFDDARGNKEMWEVASGAAVDHRFSRFNPGHKADKPRYEAGGWGALLTSAGPVYIYYDAKQFDFMQYWFGGDSEWHYTFEPHTKPVELKPGESVNCRFTLAYDSKEVPFDGPTVSFEQPNVPEVIQPGGTLKIKCRATTVRDRSEPAKLAFEVKDPKGAVLMNKPVGGDVQPFVFADLSTDLKIPDGSPLGVYTWRMIGTGEKEQAAGKFEVVTAEEQSKRITEKATADLRAQIEKLKQEMSIKDTEARRLGELWKEGVNLALTWDDPRIWGDATAPARRLSVSVEPRGVTVLGDWKNNESVRIKALVAETAPAWPANPDKLLAALGNDRALVRDVAVAPDGKSLVALAIDVQRGRCEIVRLGEGGIVRRFGEFSDKPGESDPKLGAGARAIAIDASGNIWVTTNAWGRTSVFRLNQDGSPFEESVIGAKGALKKFSPEGNLLGAISLLEAPTDLALARADDTPVVMVSYRQVSAYHGAQVREGVMLVRQGDVQRFGEIKLPGGSVAVDSAGQVWAADVAGHIACYELHGRKQFDVKGTAAAAVPDAALPAGSALPVVLRPAKEGIWALSTLRRTLAHCNSAEPPVAIDLPASAGTLWRLSLSGQMPIVVGEKELFISKR